MKPFSILFLTLFVLFLSACTSSKQTQSQQIGPFFDLRNKALRTTPQKLNVTIPDSQTVVYGIVMDSYLGNGVATVTAYKNGDAAMYISSGGGTVGDGSNVTLHAVALSYLSIGQTFLSKAAPTTATPLPDPKTIRFYFLTNKGTYFVQEKRKHLSDETSDWLPLYLEANKVLGVLKMLRQ